VAGLAGLDAVRAVALLAVGAGHQDGTDTFVGIAGQHSTGPDHLVVGVRVYGHHGQIHKAH
jgi:hypothetical protein